MKMLVRVFQKFRNPGIIILAQFFMNKRAHKLA
jgi:hypothetical protein